MKQLFLFLQLFLLSITVEAQHHIKKEITDEPLSSFQALSGSLFSKVEVQQVELSSIKDATFYQEFQLNYEVVNQIKQSDFTFIQLQTPFYEKDAVTLLLKKSEQSSIPSFVMTEEGKKYFDYQSKVVHYYGIVQGIDQSMVSLNIIDDEVRMIISDKSGNHNIGKLKNKSHYALLPAWNVNAERGGCHSDELPQMSHRSHDTFLSQNPEIQPNDEGDCVRIYFELDYQTFLDKGSEEASIDYMNALFNEISLLFSNESLIVEISEILVWTTPDPYPHDGSSTSALFAFRDALSESGFNGDLAHLISSVPQGRGGVAYLGTICISTLSFAFSEIEGSFLPVPAYSWDVEVVTHELGHNFGSPHTHDCNWNDNDTQIDDCGNVASVGGDCYDPLSPILPTDGGSIMSYCHLLSNVGINLANGFGPQPGELLRLRVAQATCLSQCCEFSYPLDLGEDSFFCNGESTILDPGTPDDLNYLWSTGETTPTISVSTSGIYSVSVSDDCSSAQDEIEVIFSDFPVFELPDQIGLCGPEITVDATNSQTNSYLWSNGETTPSITVNSLGDYWVELTNACGTKREEFTVVASVTPEVDLGEDLVICEGQSASLDATTSGNTTYLWSTGETTATISVSESGTYQVSITNDCGTATDEIIVEVEQVPQNMMAQVYEICQGESITVNALTANTNSYLWSSGETSSSITIDNPGNYWVDTTNDCGTSRTNFEVVQKPHPNISLLDEYILCPEEVFVLDATIPDATYLWQDGSTDATFSVSEPGNYTVEVNLNGCVESKSVDVTYLQPISLNLGEDKVACLRDAITLVAQDPNATSVLWQDGSINSVYVATETGNYSVELSNICETVADQIFLEFYECCIAQLPTAFSPNRDGMNDTFRPFFDCTINEFEFTIYNRWGNEVFYTNEATMGWDGTANGEFSPPGIYVWTLSYFDKETNQNRAYQGTVSLFR